MANPFQPLNEYFDKILVLTLPRLTDRIDYFNKTFDGLHFDFFYGVDKEKTSLDILKQQGLYSTEAYRKNYKKPAEISLGMLCCSLGHIYIYDYIIENNIAKTLIFEDDAVPVFSEIEKFPAIIKELPQDWDLLYLGYEKHDQLGWKEKLNQRYLTWFPHHTQLHLGREVFKNYYAVPVSKHIAQAGFHDCAHAYALTLEGAKKLKKHSLPVSMHSDNLLPYLNCTGVLTGYISRTKLFTQLSAFVHKIESMTAH